MMKIDFLLSIVSFLISIKKCIAFIANIIPKIFSKYFQSSHKELAEFLNSTNYFEIDYKNILTYNNFRSETEYRNHLEGLFEKLVVYVRREVINKTIIKDNSEKLIEQIIIKIKGYNNNMLISNYGDRETEINKLFGFNVTKFNYKNYGLKFSLSDLPEKIDIESYISIFHNINIEYINKSILFMTNEKKRYYKFYYLILFNSIRKRLKRVC